MSSKVASNLSEEQLRDRQKSQEKKKQELEKKKESYAEDRKRAELNREKAEELAKKNAKKKKENYSYQIMFGLLGALIVYVIVMTFVSQAPPLHKVLVVDKDKIDSFNRDSLHWKQDANTFFEGATLADAKKLFGSGFSSSNNLNRCFNDDTIIPPESFHVKEVFPQCTLPVEDTGKSCGSSYAFVLAQTLAERACIANSSEKSNSLSAQELLTCDSSNNGCKGGQLNTALEYITSKGLVDQECYKYKPESDKCEGLCENPTRTKADSFCLLIGEDDIKRDIMKNGAAVSALQIFIDILTYKSGVYTKGDEVARFSGQHAIKIVGWGVESEGENAGTKYWIIQNTWGTTWGEEGYAKIAVGQQDLFFEQYAYSIKAKVNRKPIQEESIHSHEDHKTETNETVNLDLDDAPKSE